MYVTPLSCDYLLRLSDESETDDCMGFSQGELAAMHKCMGLFLGSCFFLLSDAVIEWKKKKPCNYKQLENASLSFFKWMGNPMLYVLPGLTFLSLLGKTVQLLSSNLPFLVDDEPLES